jgi:hypothetical protein
VIDRMKGLFTHNQIRFDSKETVIERVLLRLTYLMVEDLRGDRLDATSHDDLFDAFRMLLRITFNYVENVAKNMR